MKVKQLIVNNGLILGAFSVTLSIIMYALNMYLNPHWSISLISILVMAGVISFAVRSFKNNNNGFLTFGEALKIGIGIAIISGIISIGYILIFENFIEPDIANQRIEILRQAMLDRDIDEDIIEKQIEMTKKFQSPFITSAITLAFSAFLGFVISAIAGGIMQKKQENNY